MEVINRPEKESALTKLADCIINYVFKPIKNYKEKIMIIFDTKIKQYHIRQKQNTHKRD